MNPLRISTHMNSENTTPVGVDSTVKVRRGRVDCVTLYDVSESELDQLEAGSPATLQLNFAIFCFSLSITAGTSLVTADFKNEKWMIAFMIASLVGIVLGAFFIFAWNRNRKSVHKLINRIRQRVQSETSTSAIVSIQDRDGKHEFVAGGSIGRIPSTDTSKQKCIVNNEVPQRSVPLLPRRYGPPVRPSNPPCLKCT